MPELCTIGYEGKDLNKFVDELKNNKVDTLVDVREMPLSRKPGFSKTPMMKFLKSKGIEYVHVREVGSPKPMRKELYNTWNYERFFRKYDNHLRKSGKAVSKIVEIVHSRNACLMCYEADQSKCHRSHLAKEIRRAAGNRLQIKNL